MQPERDRAALLAIAIFKLLKAAALIGIGVTILSLARDSSKLSSLEHVADHLKLGPNRHLVDRALSAISGLAPKRLKELSLGTFVYAAVFLTEGTGLWLRRHWAEYMTTLVTASFVPFELYELVRRVSWLKLVGLLLNVAILAYLVAHIWGQRASKKKEPAASAQQKQLED
jgi:uncharacterized membrane protein (DUF2068 family)